MRPWCHFLWEGTWAVSEIASLYPHSLFPALVHSYSSLEGVNGNEGVNSAPEGLPLCIVFLLFNNHLKRAAPVRLKDLSWTLSRKLCINPNSPFTVNVYLCCITPRTSASKIKEWTIQLRAPSSGETREFIQRATLTMHYGDYLAVECTSVVHSFLQCIVGLNECSREHPLWFRTPLKIAVL